MSTNVVQMDRFRKMAADTQAVEMAAAESPDVGDDTIRKFFKMCDYLRTLGEDNTAVVKIGIDRLEIEAEHFRELQDGAKEGSCIHSSRLTLTSSMDFPEEGEHNVEDLREVVDHLILD